MDDWLPHVLDMSPEVLAWYAPALPPRRLNELARMLHLDPLLALLPALPLANLPSLAVRLPTEMLSAVAAALPLARQLALVMELPLYKLADVVKGQAPTMQLPLFIALPRVRQLALAVWLSAEEVSARVAACFQINGLLSSCCGPWPGSLLWPYGCPRRSCLLWSQPCLWSSSLR